MLQYMTTNADPSPHAPVVLAWHSGIVVASILGTMDVCSDNDWVCMAMYRIMEYMQLIDVHVVATISTCGPEFSLRVTCQVNGVMHVQ